jgi:hypothetical protein
MCALTRRYHGCCWGCVYVYYLWDTYVQMCQGPDVLDAVKDIILPLAHRFNGTQNHILRKRWPLAIYSMFLLVTNKLGL